MFQNFEHLLPAKIALWNQADPDQTASEEEKETVIIEEKLYVTFMNNSNTPRL